VNPIFGAAHEVERACGAHGWRFCFIGGLAVQRWGEPRLTQDVDLTLLTGFGGEETFVDGLLEVLAPRLSDARAFALSNRVLLLEASNGVPVDVSLGAMPFEERAIERASAFAVGDGVTLTTCSAEDLVVHKAFAGRDKDWLDIDGIVRRQGAKLDRALIVSELDPLLNLRDDRAPAERLAAIFSRR